MKVVRIKNKRSTEVAIRKDDRGRPLQSVGCFSELDVDLSVPEWKIADVWALFQLAMQCDISIVELVSSSHGCHCGVAKIGGAPSGPQHSEWCPRYTN